MNGGFWSSSLVGDSDGDARCLYFDYDGPVYEFGCDSRYYGQSVRGVQA
jgi:hypothetical protein